MLDLALAASVQLIRQMSTMWALGRQVSQGAFNSAPTRLRMNITLGILPATAMWLPAQMPSRTSTTTGLAGTHLAPLLRHAPLKTAQTSLPPRSTTPHSGYSPQAASSANAPTSPKTASTSPAPSTSTQAAPGFATWDTNESRVLAHVCPVPWEHTGRAPSAQTHTATTALLA